MARFATLLTVVLLFQSACKPRETKHENPAKIKIDSLETEVRKATEKNPGQPDLNLAMHLAKEYQNYEVDYPKDSLSPTYLFKAGQLIENVFEDKARAGEIYYAVFKKYPQSKAAPFALFMTGNMYHTIQDTTHAVQMLQFFLDKYPGHELGDDAMHLIQSFGQKADTTSRPVKELPMNPL